MKFKLFTTAVFCFFYTLTFAQNRSAFFDSFKADKLVFRAGFNIGGIAPTSIPQEVRDIEGYKPITPFSFGVEIPFFQIDNKWELITGLNVKSNGMKAGAFVENFRGMINLENTPYQNIFGYFTGSVKTNAHNWYLEIPIQVRYSFNEKWKMLGGISFSNTISRSFEGGVRDAYIRLGAPTAQKIDVPNATFKTSSQIRKFDFGGQLGAECRINNIWDIRGMVNYGFTNVLNPPKENLPVSLHNVFFNLTAGYALPLKK
ncbi:Outer membrane protein beta-barrel domain-containing protein [Pedobacter sp. ok626]|uniref:porin family protein n=1 Tax=Pedobacter sp. ok626 TaxID=1761882 RepID=UPI00088807E7|nr:porin family protein [Pedobacter sp. ok626]SDK56880.1 Outer membrane protein beta-barrel domain-containing protein [Pedobacter sp. ok626]